MNKKLTSLFSLLEDENEKVACAAMHELLKYEKELDGWLPKYQGSNKPIIRKRVHQLQAIILLRKRRKEFANLIKNKNLHLIDGLIAVHLQWYDNDSERTLRTQWQKLITSAEKFSPNSLQKIAYFMRKEGFFSIPTADLQADSFCIGSILEEKSGADFILCAITAELAARWNLELKIVRFMGKFTLINADNEMLFPQQNWQITPPIGTNYEHTWSYSKLVELAASMLFLLAVGSDSFRYIHTIASALQGVPGDIAIDFLPYPYGKNNSSSD